MGVDGLLRQLQDAVQTTHLRDFQGQRVVVDALSWLHKAYVLLPAMLGNTSGGAGMRRYPCIHSRSVVDWLVAATDAPWIWPRAAPRTRT